MGALAEPTEQKRVSQGAHSGRYGEKFIKRHTQTYSRIRYDVFGESRPKGRLFYFLVLGGWFRYLLLARFPGGLYKGAFFISGGGYQ